MENKENREILRLVAGGVVVNENGEVVLVRQETGAWTFPKGGIEAEAGEESFAAAKREIEEEAGIGEKDLEYVKDFDVYERPDSEKENVLQRINMFLFKTKKIELAPKPGFEEEIAEAKWVRMEDVIKLLSAQKDKEFFLSILKEI